VRTRLTETVTVLAGAVLLLLALACANAATLMLARSQGLRVDVATRLALGASRWRVARLFLSESVVLCLAAAAAALVMAALTSRLLEGTTLQPGLPPLGRAGLDWQVFGFAFAIAVGVSALAGMLPAIRGSRVDLRAGLAEAGRSHSADRRRTARVLTAAQVALSVTLLLGAALLVRSMQSRLSIPTGFDASSVVSFSVEPGIQGYGPRQEPFYRDLLDRVRALPGVRAAGLSWLRLYGLGAANTEFRVESDAAAAPVSSPSNMVSPGFFVALGLDFVEGRDFAADEFQRPDAAGGGVAILTESLARRTFGPGRAVGQRIVMAYPKGRVRTIVGVVSDTRQRRLVGDTGEMFFEPFGQSFPAGSASVVLGLSAPVDAVLPAVRQAVRTLDADLPIYDVSLLDDSIRKQFADDLLVMRFTAVLAGLATLLAAVGLYGVLARLVTGRRREFAVRTALGATPATLSGLVAREASVVVVTGLACGVPLSWWLARLIESRLFGVTRLDPWSAAAAVGVMVLVALVSTLPAARRAARLDPADVLR
jgi:predicted permease